MIKLLPPNITDNPKKKNVMKRKQNWEKVSLSTRTISTYFNKTVSNKETQKLMPMDSKNIEEKAVHSRYAQNSELLLAPTVIPSVTNFKQSQKPDLAAEKPVFTSQQLSANLPGPKEPTPPMLDEKDYLLTKLNKLDKEGSPLNTYASTISK